MKQRHAETMGKHSETRAACEAVTECRWSEAADLFYKATDVVQPTVSAQQGYYHIVFVLDESRSMVRLVFMHNDTPIPCLCRCDTDRYR